MRFQVPQFIEVEDKIVGPLTFKQFLYLLAGGGLAFILYRFLPPFLGLPLAGAAVIGGLALAFYRINNRPLIFTLEAVVKYFISSRMYVWQHQKKTRPEGGEGSEISSTAGLAIPAISGSRLKEMSVNIEVQDENNVVATEHSDPLLHKQAGLSSQGEQAG